MFTARNMLALSRSPRTEKNPQSGCGCDNGKKNTARGNARLSVMPVTLGDVTPMTGDAAALHFLADVKQRFPDLYQAALRELARTGNSPAALAAIGESTGWFDKLSSGVSKLTETVTNLAPAYLQFKAQKDLLDANLKRAKQGMPPIDSATVAPTVKVQHGADPQVIHQMVTTIADRAKQDWQKPMLYGFGGLLVVSVLAKVLQNRKRR